MIRVPASRAGVVSVVLLSLVLTSTHAAAQAKADPAKVEALAKKIDAEARQGSLALLLQTFDNVAIVDRALAGVDTPADFRQGMLASPVSKSFLGDLERKLQAGSNYRLLRVREVKGHTRALFRYTGDDGVNYHEFEFADGPSGPRIVDVYVVVTGERLSATLRRMALPALFHLAKEMPGKKVPDQTFAKDMEGVLAFVKLARSGQGKEALKAYDALSNTLKKDPAVMVLRIAAAANSGDDTAHLRAIDDFRATHPDSPAAPLLSIDAYIIREKWDEAMKAVDQLDKLIGGDPYLEVIRANITFAQEQIPNARAFLDRAIQREPTMADAYYTAIDLALLQKDFDEVARLLSAATRNAGITWPDLSKSEGFAEFVNSPAYKRWREESAK